MEKTLNRTIDKIGDYMLERYIRESGIDIYPLRPRIVAHATNESPVKVELNFCFHHSFRHGLGIFINTNDGYGKAIAKIKKEWNLAKFYLIVKKACWETFVWEPINKPVAQPIHEQLSAACIEMELEI